MNQVKLKFFKTRNLPLSSNNYIVYIYDCIKFESSLGSRYFLTMTQEPLWIKQNEKLIIYRILSDENSHFPQEINVYISEFTQRAKTQNKLRSQVLFKYFEV